MLTKVKLSLPGLSSDNTINIKSRQHNSLCPDRVASLLGVTDLDLHLTFVTGLTDLIKGNSQHVTIAFMSSNRQVVTKKGQRVKHR